MPEKLTLARLQAHALAASVFAGGCLGALARAGLDRAFPAPAAGWPWATLAANLVGTALLALFATRLQERLPPSTYRRPLLGTGFCGALTTFSTLQIELIRIARDGHAGLSAGYFAVSLAGGVALMFAVTKLVRESAVPVSAPAWISMALVGGVGAVSRFWLDGAISARRQGGFPLGTLIVNASGSFVLGLLTGAGVSGTALFIAATGLLGSFTTFSTWILETERLSEDGELVPAAANLAVSVGAGLAAAGAGWAIGALL